MFMGVGFFGYIIGNIQTVIVQDDSISELKELYEKDINLWLIKLSKLNKNKALNSEYFIQSVGFLLNLWDKDYSKLQNDELFMQLKPRLQNQIYDRMFENAYNHFKYFFKDLEYGFRREIVSNMKYESFSKFNPYHDKYKDDKHSFPLQLK